MQRQSQPSPSSLSEDVKEERCCGMENWGVIALEIEHLAVVGEGEFGVWHQLSSNVTVNLENGHDDRGPIADDRRSGCQSVAVSNTRTKLWEEHVHSGGSCHSPETHGWLPA